MTYDILVLDFETYWDTNYTLSKMTTDSYVLDPQFHAFGCGVWLRSWGEERSPLWLSGAELDIFFAGVDWSTTAVMAHNTAFDGFILTQRYGYKPAYYYDTLSMARALIGVQVGGSLKKVAEHYKLGVKGDEVMNTKGLRTLSLQQLAALGAYCTNDVQLCWRAFQVMRESFIEPELDLIDTTIRMFTEPSVWLDEKLLEQELINERARKAEILERSGATVEVLGSNKQFAQLLWMFGVDCPTKISPRTGKETYALAKTDEGFVELLNHDDEAIRMLAEARLAAKSTLQETRTERFLTVAKGNRPWPVLLNYYGAGTTGRWSGGNRQNPQNLPSGRKKGTTRTLRNSVLAPHGYKIVVGDSAQIEARTLAHQAKQDDLVEVFRTGGDPYCRMATAVYKREITKADVEERWVGKMLVLGCGYGMSSEKFMHALRAETGIALTAQAASLAVLTYRCVNPQIVKFWELGSNILRIIARGGTANYGPFAVGPAGIHLPNGLWIKYPDLRQDVGGFTYATKHGRTKIYGGKVIENLIQALARIIVAEQMHLLERRVLRRVGGRIWLMAHDEICALVPERFAEPVKQAMLLIMSTPPNWAPTLPVAAEVGIGDTYGAAK